MRTNHKSHLTKSTADRPASLSASATQTQGTVESWEHNLSGGDENEILSGPRPRWWFTGKHPEELVSASPSLGGAMALHSLPQPTLENCTEAGVRDYFDNTWTLTEVQFSALQGEEAFYRPPYHHLRHPMIFYYGHTATFYTNKLNVAGLVKDGINPYFEDIFEVGVDEMRWDDMSKNEMEWPSVLEVHEYRKQTYELVQDVINANVHGSGNSKVGPDHPLWALFMSFEHDRIHLETSSVLLREMPLDHLQVPEYWPGLHPSAYGEGAKSHPQAGTDFVSNELLGVQGSTVRIGKEVDFPSYGWDNEYGHRAVTVPDFEAAKSMVSNGEFYEFVAAGGYRDEKYWSEDGWGWRKFRNAKWPFFWQQAGPSGKHEYRLRASFETIDMPWDWPVNVNKHEATAFCKWKESTDPAKYKGLRLLTEAEHLLLRDESQRHPVADPANDPALVHGGATMSNEGGRNLNLAYGSESPVTFHEPNARGFHDVTGNAWEWTEDEFNPLDGFKVHSYYDDFSTPCFDGEHNMIMGGSFMSSGDAGANSHCRYHFRPHFLQHSGFRYVKPSKAEEYPGQGIATLLSKNDNGASSDDVTNADDSKDSEYNPAEDVQEEKEKYETQQLMDQYLALHYGQAYNEVAKETVRPHDALPELALNFPGRCAELLRTLYQQFGPRDRTATATANTVDASALDIGCAVGGASFMLSRGFSRVVGIDYSEAFIDMANEINQKSKVSFTVATEGGARSKNVMVGIDRRKKTKTKFFQADACELTQDDIEKFGGKFDAVLMANLLCRLPDPDRLLEQLPNMITSNGIVLIISPFSWMEAYTPRDKWLQQGDEANSEDVLVQKMQDLGFKRVYSTDMPLIIREHERKYQYIVAQASAFRYEPSEE